MLRVSASAYSWHFKKREIWLQRSISGLQEEILEVDFKTSRCAVILQKQTCFVNLLVADGEPIGADESTSR